MYKEIWQQYCGFLDLSMKEYMALQKRLMEEQISLYANCELGRRILGTDPIESVEEYREKVPLTKYEDYADILLGKRIEALPMPPVIWIETTWEGGWHPIKTAPYTQSMVDHHRGSIVSTLLLATSSRKGQFSLRRNPNFLFGMAPLPFFTGIIPYVIEGQLSVNFMPPVNDANRMSFGERNKQGFKLGVQKDIDLFLGMGSVVMRMSELLPGFMSGGKGLTLDKMLKIKPKMLWRLLRAKARCKKNGTPLMPKDIWKPKGLMCGGTDSAHFKKRIAEYWGVQPTEIFGGTEPTCIASETWSKNGMVFFPDICFYEFIPEHEMERSLEDPSYQPYTLLMDELVAGEKYELVISNFKGGAFMRYRVGDVFRCVSTSNETDGIDFPQFEYVDRIPTVIDIAGFTRVTENTVQKAIDLSLLQVHNWFAVKRYDETDRPYMQLYMEMEEGAALKDPELLTEHLSAYFRYVDDDYKDLRKMLGIDPLVITLVPFGMLEQYSEKTGRKLRKINPPACDVTEIDSMLAASCCSDALPSDGAEDKGESIVFPQSRYVESTPRVIDIAGFTRVTENTIQKVIDLSLLQVHNWFAVKRCDPSERPHVQLYLEMAEEAVLNGVVDADILTEHLSAYFCYVDSGYRDLKKMLGKDPLVVTLLPAGTVERYSIRTGKKIRRIDPFSGDVTEIEQRAGIV